MKKWQKQGLRPGMTRPGDWYCPYCGDYQFGKNRFCRMCNMQKPVSLWPLLTTLDEECGNTTGASPVLTAAHVAAVDHHQLNFGTAYNNITNNNASTTMLKAEDEQNYNNMLLHQQQHSTSPHQRKHRPSHQPQNKRAGNQQANGKDQHTNGHHRTGRTNTQRLQSANQASAVAQVLALDARRSLEQNKASSPRRDCDDDASSLFEDIYNTVLGGQRVGYDSTACTPIRGLPSSEFQDPFYGMKTPTSKFEIQSLQLGSTAASPGMYLTGEQTSRNTAFSPFTCGNSPDKGLESPEASSIRSSSEPASVSTWVNSPALLGPNLGLDFPDFGAVGSFGRVPTYRGMRLDKAVGFRSGSNVSTMRSESFGSEISNDHAFNDHAFSHAGGGQEFREDVDHYPFIVR
ncbi:unnamed protein product [Amoebophrya sp. A25]|nr:unnamed protein product [Amoebophrya sp. A25]|eukprot:GSA25T00020840001.1